MAEIKEGGATPSAGCTLLLVPVDPDSVVASVRVWDDPPGAPVDVRVPMAGTMGSKCRAKAASTPTRAQRI